MSENVSHYSNLTEYHLNAYNASQKLAEALERKASAEADIRTARKSLAAAHELINKYYLETRVDE